MIEVENLTKGYGRISAIRDVSFTVDRGEILDKPPGGGTADADLPDRGRSAEGFGGDKERVMEIEEKRVSDWLEKF